MTYSVRYQVFVSSTFTDLKDERAEVIQALWELDCIPTGMEAFVASNESQWQVIKRVIDECDYYVLIIGGRYGTVTPDGISYTEKEYRYAKQIGLPVLAFVHADPTQIVVAKSESDDLRRAKLEEFRAEVMTDHPVRAWSSAAELGGLVSRSLNKEAKINPRPGWVRNDGSSPVALLERINKLTEENSALKDSAPTSPIVNPEGLAQGEDEYTLKGDRQVKLPDGRILNERWEAEASWDELFKDLGPLVLNEASESEIEQAINRFHGWSDKPKNGVSIKNEIDPETVNEILIQFRAIGMIDKGKKRRAISDRSRYWSITPKGESYLLGLLAIRK